MVSVCKVFAGVGNGVRGMVRFCIKVNKAKGLGTELPIGNIRQNELVMCYK